MPFHRYASAALIPIPRVGYAELASAVSNAGGLGIVRSFLITVQIRTHIT